MPKTHVSGYYRKDGTYVRGYTQNRAAGGRHGGHDGPGRRALIVGVAVAAVGAWFFRGQVLSESTPVSSVTRIKTRKRAANIGKIRFELPEQEVEFVPGEDHVRQIRLLVDVTNGDIKRTTLIFEEQQVRTDADRTYNARRGRLAVAPGKPAHITLTFVISDTEIPVAISLRLGGRVVVLTVGEQAQ